MYIDSYGYLHYSRTRYVHREIAEASLGRLLRSDEIVHHINHDKLDNRPENLLICTQTEHMIIHAKDDLIKYGGEIGKDSFCQKCLTVFSLDKFNCKKSKWNGRDDWCKACRSEYKKKKGYNLRKNRQKVVKVIDNLQQQYRRINKGYTTRPICWLPRGSNQMVTGKRSVNRRLT